MSTERLSRLRKCIQVESNDPTEVVLKSDVESHKRYSDVVLPLNCEQRTRTWLDSQPEDVPVRCRKCPRQHRNARKKCNRAKSDDIMERYLLFVDSNSASNGRKEGSSGKHSILIANLLKFVLLTKRILNLITSVSIVSCWSLIARLTEDGLKPISVETFHNWLKQHRPYVGIRPSMSDYCDKCKEFEEEISRCQQIVNRMVQSGHATESEYMHAFLTLIHGDMHNMFTYRTYIYIPPQHTHHIYSSCIFMYMQLLLQSSILINLTYLLLQRRLLNRNQECLSSEKITKNIKTMLRMLSSTIGSSKLRHKQSMHKSTLS